MLECKEEDKGQLADIKPNSPPHTQTPDQSTHLHNVPVRPGSLSALEVEKETPGTSSPRLQGLL